MYTRVAGRIRRYPVSAGACAGRATQPRLAGTTRTPWNAPPARRREPSVADFSEALKRPDSLPARRVADQHPATVALVALDRGLAEVAERSAAAGRTESAFAGGMTG